MDAFIIIIYHRFIKTVYILLNRYNLFWAHYGTHATAIAIGKLSYIIHAFIHLSKNALACFFSFSIILNIFSLLISFRVSS